MELDGRRLQRQKTAELLRGQRTSLQVIEAADHAANLADESIQKAIRIDPPKAGIACQVGCAWCCHKLVGTTAPEVFRIAAYFQESLPAKELENVKNRIIRRDEERKVLQTDRWSAARLPCSLLVDNRCTIYAVRPLTCRGYNSSDAGQCERWVKVRGHIEVPTYEIQRRLTTFILDGLRAGLGECHLPNDLLELTAALRIALTLPDAMNRWLAGEPIFEPARMR
jgi:Fe-S-cluster containining protein